MITFKFPSHDREVTVHLTEKLAQAIVIAIHQSRMRAMTVPVSQKHNTWDTDMEIQVEPGNRVVMVRNQDIYSRQISAVDYGTINRFSNLSGFYGLAMATILLFEDRVVVVYADDREPVELRVVESETHSLLIHPDTGEEHDLEDLAKDTGLDIDKLAKLFHMEV